MGRAEGMDATSPSLVTRPVRLWWFALLALVVGVVAGCSDGGDDEAVPAPGPAQFADGDLSEIPLPTGATAIGPRSEDEGVVSRSYGVENLPPNELAEQMDVDLLAAGWEELLAFEESGQQVFRGEYAKDERRLEVAISPGAGLSDQGPQLEGEEVEGSQISLVLHPDLTGAPTYTGVPATAPDEDGETG